jgi:hypothetical protein
MLAAITLHLEAFSPFGGWSAPSLFLAFKHALTLVYRPEKRYYRAKVEWIEKHPRQLTF